MGIRVRSIMKIVMSSAVVCVACACIIGCSDGSNGVNNIATVNIGGKTWMKKNLNVQTADSWCYDDDPANCAKYGRLYTWESAKSACAGLGGGWRLPDNDDWDALVTAAGGATTAGTKLKSSTGWEPYPGVPVGTDTYGFSALPGGNRLPDGSFFNAGYNGLWWTAVEYGASVAWLRGMGYSDEYVLSGTTHKPYGFSVRCVRD